MRHTRGTWRHHHHRGRSWPVRRHQTKAEKQAALNRYKIGQAKDLLETLSIYLHEGTLREAQKAVRALRRILKTDEDVLPDKCSFCEEKAVTDYFSVGACSGHRLAFIEGKLGENACISIKEHALMTDLKKFVDKVQHEVYFDSLDGPDRPTNKLKGKSR